MSKSEIQQLGHDLRNILAPAMMLAERLTMNQDPAIRRAGKMILDSLDRATAAIKEASKTGE